MIMALAAPRAEPRAFAAHALHTLGTVLSDCGAQRWLADSEFAQLLVYHGHAKGREPPRPATTVGVAVSPTRFEQIRAANGSPRLAEIPQDQDAMEFELHFGPHVRLDILTTKAPGGGGAIARFLEQFGEGIQQVEYEVINVDRATEILRTRFGQQPVYPATRPGADGTRVNFFLTSTPEGKKVLIELVEVPRRGPA